MSSNITLPVGSEQEGQRIDKFLQESLPGMSRSQAQKWIAQGLVRIGEKAAGKNDKLKSGMVVSVELPVPPEEKAEQLRELDRLVQEKKLKVQRGYWPASVAARYLEKWEQEALRRGEEQHG